VRPTDSEIIHAAACLSDDGPDTEFMPNGHWVQRQDRERCLRESRTVALRLLVAEAERIECQRKLTEDCDL
jgi:hypothetical protein